MNGMEKINKEKDGVKGHTEIASQNQKSPRKLNMKLKIENEGWF